MNAPTIGATITRLNEGGRIWVLGAQEGDHAALAILAGELVQRWRRGDKLVVLGNTRPTLPATSALPSRAYGGNLEEGRIEA